MGRKRVTLGFIESNKTRVRMFEKRKQGLLKKAEEFATLCDVDTCVIVYCPDDREPAIWPQNPDRVKQVVCRYINEEPERRSKHAVGLPEFLTARKKKLWNEFTNSRAANLAAKYPLPDEFIGSLGSLDQCRDVESIVENKLESVKKRLQAAKEKSDMISPGKTQALMIGPNLPLPQLMNTNSNSVMRVENCLPNSASGNDIFVDSQNVYSFPVPSYDRNPNLTKLETFPGYWRSMNPMDQFNQMTAPHPQPDNAMFDCFGHGMLSNTSSMMTDGSNSMMWPHAWNPLINTSIGIINTVLDCPDTGNYYDYSFGIPVIGNSFSQSTLSPTQQCSMDPMDQFSQAQGAHFSPAIPSSAMTMMPPAQNPPMLQYPMMHQDYANPTITSSDQGHMHSSSVSNLNPMALLQGSDNYNH